MDFHTLDVFTLAPYSGNPLAVVLGADDLTTAQMQTVAREFNLSETIFVQTPDDAAHSAKVRIFFPTAEIPFAGHPTIGCAILLAEQQNSGDFSVEITLEEVAGLVPVQVVRKDGVTRAEFTAPVNPFAVEGSDLDVDNVAAGLGLEVPDIGFGAHVCGHWQGGPSFLYVPVSTSAALSKAAPNGAAWERLTAAADCNSAYLYTPDGSGGFTSRMFAPGVGIPEDPATGSASAIFAAQLLAAGELFEGENKFALEQGVDMGRPSQIGLSVDVSGGAIIAVRIAGTAVQISSGTLGALPLPIQN